MRLVRLAPALAVVSLVPVAPAQAQGNAASVIETFLTDKDLFAASEATVGGVTEDGGTVRVSDAAIRWSMNFGSAEMPRTFEASIRAPTLEVDNLAAAGERWSADRIALPTLEVKVGFGEGNQTFAYDITARDYVITKADWAKLPEIQANEAAPVSRFAPLVDWSISQAYEKASVAGIDGTFTMPDSTQKVTFGAMEFNRADNGFVESFSYGETVSTQDMQVPNPDPNAEVGSMVPMTFTMKQGGSRGSDVDSRPIVQLLTGTGDFTGPAPVTVSTTMDSTTMTIGEMANVSIGPSTMEGFTIDPTRGPLMGALDALVVAGNKGEEPNPEDVIGLMLDVYGAFGLERYSLASVDATFTGGTAKMGEIAIEDLSAAGLGRFGLSGIEVSAEGSSFRLGSLEVADFVFPARDAFMSMMMGSMAGMQPDFQSVAGALPLLGRLAIDGVVFDNPALGSMRLGSFETRLENYVNAIPTSSAITLSGLKLPVAMLPDPTVQMAAQELGLTDIEANGEIALGWDRDSQRVEFDNDLAVTGVGQLEASAALAGIPAYIFEDPTRAQEALATAALVGLAASFEDSGLTSYAVNYVAQMSGVSPQDFVQGISQQAAMQVGMMTGDQALGEQIASALQTFLSDPRSLSIELAPGEPVPVAQIMGAAMTAPQTLPGLLNFSISANP